MEGPLRDAAAPGRSVEDQLVGDDLSDPGADGVHALDPGEGIGGLEGLGNTLGLGQLLDHSLNVLITLREHSTTMPYTKT